MDCASALLTSVLFILFICLFWTQFFRMPFADLDALTRCSCWVERNGHAGHMLSFSAADWHFGSHAGTVRYGTVGPLIPFPNEKGPILFFFFFLLLLLLSLSLYLYVCVFQCALSVAHSPPLRTTFSMSPSSITTHVFSFYTYSIFLLCFKFVWVFLLLYAARFAQFRKSIHSLEVLLLRTILSTGRSVKCMARLFTVRLRSFSLFSLLLREGIRFPLSHFSSITFRVRN